MSWLFRFMFALPQDSGAVKRLLSSCPVLEDLSIFISYCDMQNIRSLKISNPSLKRFTLDFMCNLLEVQLDIVIDLPSLVYFKYHGFRAYNYSMGNMPSLVTADINISVRNSERETFYRRSHGLIGLLI
ncbi:hypothetical protein V6N13_134143 [Hibiscus sabdariffa]|uniref:Uncharacterized protein n=2 Tax=Hibiscus sabdariffa TaxID=183260 RepID=A0ABR2AC99_9ROSI